VKSHEFGAFPGDGEMDEPESSGALSLAARENLDNLVWVVNCNLQRLDGPVRGNGKIIQELEALFRGAWLERDQSDLGFGLGPTVSGG
jgi:pyruvate dehydrogenase E1 component